MTSVSGENGPLALTRFQVESLSSSSPCPRLRAFCWPEVPRSWLATASLLGPTFAPQELAGRKVVALFDRAEARDFADVFELTQHFSKDDLLEQAAQVDRGFDRPIFAQMLRSLDRFTDEDLPAPKPRSWR